MAMRERIESPFGARGSVPDAPTGATAGDVPAVAASRLGLRELTGFEEEYLERHAAEPNTARLCNEILARCLVAPGEDPAGARETVRALLVAERDRELVALRRLSLGPQVSALVPCSRCGEQSEADFSLDALPLQFESPAGPVSVSIEGIGEVLLRLPTAGDQEELFDAGVESGAVARSWLIARCLQRFGDREGAFDLDFARSLPVSVRAALESAIEERLPDLDLEMAVECSYCAAPIVAPLDVPVFFFSS